MKPNMSSYCTVRVFTIRKSELTAFNVGTVSGSWEFSAADLKETANEEPPASCV